MSPSTHVWHYDGVSAARHDAELIPTGSGFRLDYPGNSGEVYGWSDLQPQPERDGHPVFGHKLRRGWRIGFLENPPPELAAHFLRGSRYGGVIDRFGLWPTAAAFAAVSAAVVLVVLKAPDWIAPLVPESFEQKLGDAMVGDFGGRICNGPGGQAALDKMVARIEARPQGLKVRVVNINMVNAVALPGGNIFIFRGLLQEAKSPDEVAGVVGHEIGHVRNRDVMQALLRQTGLSVILGGAGGNAGGYLNALVSATYSRGAEARADRYAIRALERGTVSPVPTAGFFQRLAAQEKKLGRSAAALGYISSHPLSASREKAFLASKSPNANYAPVLDREEWDRLIDICHNDPKVGKDDGLFF